MQVLFIGSTLWADLVDIIDHIVLLANTQIRRWCKKAYCYELYETQFQLET